MQDTTSPSLLIRLQTTNEREAWSRFVDLYTPLIYYWACKQNLSASDASDLVQDVMSILVQKLPNFKYDSNRSFRGWLRTVTINQYRQRFRKRSIPLVETTDSRLSQVEATRDEDTFWEREYRERLIGRAIELMESSFEDATWRACKAYLLEGQTADDAAKNFGVSVWTVYSAKSRLLKRLRDELDGLME